MQRLDLALVFDLDQSVFPASPPHVSGQFGANLAETDKADIPCDILSDQQVHQLPSDNR